MKVEPRSRTPKPYINLSIVLFPCDFGFTQYRPWAKHNVYSYKIEVNSLQCPVVNFITVLQSLCAM